MLKIRCASCECKWNNDNGYCAYKGTLRIATWDVNTVNMGRKSFHECKMYEESEWSKELTKNFMELIKDNSPK